MRILFDPEAVCSTTLEADDLQSRTGGRAVGVRSIHAFTTQGGVLGRVHRVLVSRSTAARPSLFPLTGPARRCTTRA